MFEVRGTEFPLDPREELARVSHLANEFNSQQQMKDRILARLQRAIASAEHQSEHDLVPGLRLAKALVGES